MYIVNIPAIKFCYPQYVCSNRETVEVYLNKNELFVEMWNWCNINNFEGMK